MFHGSATEGDLGGRSQALTFSDKGEAFPVVLLLKKIPLETKRDKLVVLM